MSAQIIDGKAYALRLRGQVGEAVAELKARDGITPGLAVVIVGEDPASQIYVRSKGEATLAAGMHSVTHRLDAATTTEHDLLALVAALNADEAIDGILVQLPLPPQIDAAAVLAAIHPDKDVDGFHVVNAGRLAVGAPALTPCTPLGCLILLRDVLGDLSGKAAVVLGRSNIVGKPVAQLLLQADCTVTIAHSRTRDLAQVCRGADILVARRRPARDGARRLDQAGRHGDRRGREPHPRARSREGGGGQDARGGRRGVRRSVAGGRAHHPRARRRRTDDDRVPAAQHRHPPPRVVAG